MKTRIFSTARLSFALAAQFAHADTIVYQDNFDNDTLATNAGIGGGLGRYSRQPGTLGVYPEGTGTWVDNGQLSGNAAGGNDRGNVYSLNSFLLPGGFRLEVSYSISDISSANANRVVIGLLDQIPTPQNDATYVTHFLAANQDRYGIGLNMTTDVGTQGLNFANDAGAGTVTNLSTAQSITVGTHTWVLEMDTTGNWSYSIDGATPTTGTIAGGFGLTRDYHFFAYVQDYGINLFKVNSVTLTQIGGTGQTPYDAWSGGADFNADANGDGVSNGLAFLLGAASKDVSALNKLPIATQSGGNLTLTFDCLSAVSRGSAVLNLQHSSDLGLTDLWTDALVPGTEPLTVTVSGVDFVTTANGALIHVVATIPAGNAAAGKLFGRLNATYTP